jgi:radical SAM superfamily enzyme YgiQ (UPF0313 family)
VCIAVTFSAPTFVYPKLQTTLKREAMNICLVSPPTVTDFEDPKMAESEAVRRISEHAPIGILSLAAVLDGVGITPHLIDLNHLYYDYLRSDRPLSYSGGFLEYLTHYFKCLAFDVFGLSTICSSYPFTIRLASEIKRLHPESAVVLGGPQASAVDVPTLSVFPFIDFIVRGEAEETLPRLLDAISSGAGWERLTGITFRQRGQVVRNPNAPVIHDLDALPTPAYHLYPYLKGANYVALELGRGCPFACKFCSTNDFFRRDFRLKSPELLIGEMKAIKETYGITTFDLIHDMFTVNRRKVAAFCEAMLECGEKFYWMCSARTDCVDDSLIDLMAEAGCRGIFFGIETGAARMQKLTNKRLDLDEAAKRIECTDRHEITTAVSLITGFPDETIDDLRDTVSFFMDSLRFDHAQPQLHILAPLAETPYHLEYRERLILDDIFSDMSYQGWRQDALDRELIASYPEIFPNFYAVPTPLDRQYLKELREFILYGIEWFRWLLVALHQDSGHLMKVFDEWRAWHAKREDLTSAPSLDWTPFYARRDFRQEFLPFVKSHYNPTFSKARSAISALVDFGVFSADIDQREDSGSTDQTAAGSVESPVFNLDTVPVLAKDIFLTRLEADYNEIIECLRTKGRLDLVSEQPVTMAAKAIKDKPVEFIQLSAASAKLIHLCDGKRSIGEIADMYSAVGEDFRGIPPHKACVFGLALLSQEGLVVAQ